MEGIRQWVKQHPNLWEFIMFNLLSNCATIVNFLVMWLGTGFIFTTWNQTPFRFLIFNYTDVERDLGLCGFLSFLAATAIAQAVNFYVQKSFVFHSNAAFSRAIPRYIGLAVLLIAVSAALPAYSQTLMIEMGILPDLVPTLANMVNIVVQVVISYPAMKYFIMPDR